ncbi:class I tRNA ligase family protein, partial [Candidatus Bathyarchaeota archaeon]|nr:class I tRNA ligase family protein [Candidatus Bathyarchaeota archaeon]NIU81635.1 class I tRNA ligase family protein [Candidatus Bathyarchaeota archaeon]NIV68291.1 class I tRNA ligase family protein [Candidatus Bathyarchaeota archaeon]NIW16626.1 class I tRNA ligase family protein [Candidatus Bathyarchaeota archaeon]NIW34819.1 class I tRNA ligase family protein [Candidatus Bathyarchaeota archaeon]
MGTPLPWSPEWLVETLSDSTVYMAFYTINKYLKGHNLKADQLIPEVFDYVFHSKGRVQDVAERSRIDQGILESMRDEFLYWYPVDLRNSAKELVPNHLTFFLFHHAALFPEYLPNKIGVNGMVMIEGKKMSKSKGNFVTLRDAIDRYGADSTRCALLLAAEGMGDPDWRTENVRDVKNQLQAFYKQAESITETTKKEDISHLEHWLMSRMQHRIKKVTESLEKLKTRTAIENAFYEIWNDLRWYNRRKGKTNSKLLVDTLEVWVRLMAPFAPHLCEEIWSRMGKEGFISCAEWPTYDSEKLNIDAEETEALIRNVLEDTSNILQATKMMPDRIYYYPAAPWKWKIYLKVLEMALSARVSFGDLMEQLMGDPHLKEMGGEVAGLTRQI